jgi:hypothetical protein
MVIELECPVCDAEVPLDNKEEPGDLVQCSFCKETFKLVRTKEKGLMLTEEFDE